LSVDDISENRDEKYSDGGGSGDGPFEVVWKLIENNLFQMSPEGNREMECERHRERARERDLKLIQISLVSLNQVLQIIYSERKFLRTRASL
jgi:hypothetical protein